MSLAAPAPHSGASHPDTSAPRDVSAPPWRGATGRLLAGTAVAAVASTAAPLLTYGTSLALFGLAHVLVELRYVDQRFGVRISGRLRAGLLLLLAGVVAARAAKVGGVIAPHTGTLVEVGLAAALAAAVIPALTRGGRLPAAVAAAAAMILAAATLVAPEATLLAIAVLHNLTPLGFLAEALDGPARRRQLALAAAALVGLPLLVATGLPFRALASLGLVAPELTLLPTGPLSDQFSAYLPRSMHLSMWALHAFSGAVVAQCAHYGAVLHVLPRLPLPSGAGRGVVRWPRPRVFLAGVAALGLVLFLSFAVDFKGSRQIYGIASTLHAWLELPVLLLALSAYSMARMSPSPKDAAFATADTSAPRQAPSGTNRA